VSEILEILFEMCGAPVVRGTAGCEAEEQPLPLHGEAGEAPAAPHAPQRRLAATLG